MKTDGMRILMDDPAGIDVIRAYLEAIEAHDMSALKALLDPKVELTHANYPPVAGRDEVAAMIAGYLQIVAGVEFEIRTIIGEKGCYAIEKVNVAEAPNGSLARIRVVTILERQPDGLLNSIRIYADTSDLFRKLEMSRPTRDA